MPAIMTVGICGFGVIGAGLAELCTRGGYSTAVFGKSAQHLSKGFDSIRESIDRANDKEPSSSINPDDILSQIRGTLDIADLRECDIVIEAITEDLEIKVNLLSELNEICDSAVVFASTTSSLSITEIATTCGRPANFVGLHFFNPVMKMQLVEITPGAETNSIAINLAKDMCESLGKVPVIVQDKAGFLVNRLIFPYLMDAIRLLESNTATRDEIDTAMVLGCNMPIGPLKLIDLIGVETTVQIARNLYATYGEAKYEPPDLLISMLSQNDTE